MQFIMILSNQTDDFLRENDIHSDFISLTFLTNSNPVMLNMPVYDDTKLQFSKLFGNVLMLIMDL